MHTAISALSIASLLYQVSASPAGVNGAQTNVLATKNCNHDNLYRSFVDARYSSAASALCSSFIQPTTYITTTTTTTISSTETAPLTTTETVINLGKRTTSATTATTTSAGLFATYAPASLSSACSCILTSAASTSTVYTSTVVIPTTTTTTTSAVLATATVDTNICIYPGQNHLQNSDFESGPSSWTGVSTFNYPTPAYIGVASPGYNSANSYQVQYGSVTGGSFVLSQPVTIASGITYTFSFWYMLSNGTPTGSISPQVGTQGFYDFGVVNTYHDASNQWMFYTGSFVSTQTGTVELSLQLALGSASGDTIYIDQVSLTC